LAAAITLARAGRAVEVRELRSDVGGKFHGNLQLLTNYPDSRDAGDELVELLGATPVRLWQQRSARLYGPSGKATEATCSEAFGYLVQRGPGELALDGALKHAALDAGVSLRFSERVLPGEAAIVATGGSGVQGVAREWFGETSLPDGFNVVFDNRLCPGGFGYLLVAEGHTVIGAAVVKHHQRIAESFKKMALWFEENAGAPHVEKHTLVGALDLMLGADDPQMEAPLYVGEAGGFADFLFGFGIRLALQSGKLAAECMLDGKPFGAAREAFFGDRFEASLVNRFLYETGGHAAYRFFLRKARSTEFRRIGRDFYTPTFAKRMLLPVVKALWGKRKPCVHGPRCAWCRDVKD
jgi:flavin-dependent dehydrogenase